VTDDRPRYGRPVGLHLTVVDAFTDRPFHGNPAAVALVGDFPPDERMQSIAREINLAETAFVADRPDGERDLRWFTPEVEVDLCGHATLASAHVLGGSGRFHTRSGLLTCGPGPAGRIEMDFPSDPLTPRDPDGLAAVLGPAVVSAGTGRTDILVELDDADAVRRLRPDLAGIAALGSRCVIVTAAGSDGVDCVSRVFAPNVGIAEDPVTGSAHTTLAGFWSGRTGRTDLVGEQASRRGGIVYMRVVGDRVVIGGQAVTVSEIHLVV
jgi:predicted PhzF superfamily epimerase YddE/YHI9